MKKIIVFFILLMLLPLGAYASARYELDCSASLLEKAEEIMISQVGIIEKSGRNDGEVSKYLEPFGLPSGSPYCAAGIYWSFLCAANVLGLPERTIPLPKSALANAFYDYAVKKGIRTKFFAQKSDLIVWRKPNTIYGHVEFVLSIGKSGIATTIGFNSSKMIEGKKEEGVFIQKRSIMHPLGRMKVRGIVGFSSI